MNTCIKTFRWAWILALIVLVLQMTTQQAEAGSNRPLSSASRGDTIHFGGKEWLVLEPSTGYILSKYYEGPRVFDTGNNPTFDPSNPNNIAYWLNNEYYNSLANNEWIESKDWTVGNDDNESARSVSAHVGLISKSEYGTYESLFSYRAFFWTRTPIVEWGWNYVSLGKYAAGKPNEIYSPRPALYLKSGLYLTPGGHVTDASSYQIASPQLTSPANNQVFSEAAGQNTIAISGTTKAIPGIPISVKYTIDGVTSHINQTIQTLMTNGTDQTYSKNITVDHSLPKGTYTLRVWSEDNNGEKSAETTITIRIISSNNNLSALGLSSGTLSPAFSQTTTSYSSSVGNNVTSIVVTPTVADTTATVKVNGASVASGQASGATNLDVGSNPPITVRVTAQDGMTKDYTITVYRQAGNADLSTLEVDGVPVAGFAPGTKAYKVNVPHVKTAVTVKGTVADTNANVSVIGGSGLNVGHNTETSRVTAEDPSITKDYTITVHRQADNADLRTLEVDGEPVAGFDRETLAYTVNVPNAKTAVAVTGTAADAKANVSVTGGSNLDVGDNTVTVRVTAEDPSITKDYTITVNRAASSNADLSRLILSSGILNPAFDAGVTTYTAKVGYNVATMTVTPTVADPTATVEVDDNRVASGQESSPIMLNVGKNTIVVTVTAQDGSTQKYTMKVNRQSPPPSYYPVTNVSLDPTSLTLTEGKETAVLHATVIPSYATNASVSWSSDNPEIVSVDQNGMVTPYKPGEATITVTTQDGNFTAQSLVKVEPVSKPEPAITLVGLKSSQESVLLKPGKQASLRLYAVYSDDTVKNVTSNQKTSYKSSSSSVATVKSGIIKAGKKEGDALITVRYEDQLFQIPVTVSKQGVKELQLSSEQAQLETGEDMQLQARVTFSDSTQQDVTKNAVWVSDNPEQITVNNGKLIAHSAGKATVTVHYGGKSAELEASVTEPKEVKRITASKRTVKLKAGKAQSISLTAYFKDGTKAVVTEKADWSSADESVGAVKAGTITAVGTGTTAVTVRYQGQVLTIHVTVMEP